MYMYMYTYTYMYMYMYVYMYMYIYMYVYMYIWTISECNFIRAGINRLINRKSVQGFIEQGDGRRGNIPTLHFSPNLFQHAATSQLQALWGPRSHQKQLREHKVYIFPVGEYPQTPLPRLAAHVIDSFPSLTKILYETVQ